MIRVEIKKTNEVYKEITIKGHAGFDYSGKDIVCAATSVLVINTFNAIEQFTSDYESEYVDEKSGYVRFVLKDNPGDGSKLLLDSMVLGLNEIEEQYGKKYLNVNFKEV